MTSTGYAAFIHTSRTRLLIIPPDVIDTQLFPQWNEAITGLATERVNHKSHVASFHKRQLRLRCFASSHAN